MHTEPAPLRLFPLPATMNPREIFEPHPGHAGNEDAFTLRPHEWEFYLWLDGRRTVQEISEARKLDLPWIAAAAERLQELGLIRPVEISLEEFHRRFANPANAPAAPPVEGKRVSLSLRRGTASPVRAAGDAPPPAADPAPAPAFSPAPVSVPRTATVRIAAEEFHLKPLLDFIIGQSGGGTVGQLAAYRVFLKVPNELLQRAGIQSLSLVNADFTIRDRALQRALLAAVEEVLGRPYTPPGSPSSAQRAAA